MPYQHFTSDERDALQVCIDKELKMDIIARILKKHISSLYREIARNSQKGFYLSRYADAVSKLHFRLRLRQPQNFAGMFLKRSPLSPRNTAKRSRWTMVKNFLNMRDYRKHLMLKYFLLILITRGSVALMSTPIALQT